MRRRHHVHIRRVLLLEAKASAEILRQDQCGMPKKTWRASVAGAGREKVGEVSQGHFTWACVKVLGTVTGSAHIYRAFTVYLWCV